MADEDAEMQEIRSAYEELYALQVTSQVKRLLAHREVTAITLYDTVLIDEYGTMTVGEWKGYLIQILPMLFNDRIVMSPKSCPETYDYGWCFDKGGAAYLALAVWDPQEQAEPIGFKKRVGGTRSAGEDVNFDIPVGAAAAISLFAALDAATDSVA